jgi:hypothetical protein
VGKSKKRSIVLGKHNQIANLSRDEAVSITVEKLSRKEDAENLITLFGLKAEELLEAGADYETVKSIERLF